MDGKASIGEDDIQRDEPDFSSPCVSEVDVNDEVVVDVKGDVTATDTEDSASHEQHNSKEDVQIDDSAKDTHAENDERAGEKHPHTDVDSNHPESGMKEKDQSSSDQELDIDFRVKSTVDEEDRSSLVSSDNRNSEDNLDKTEDSSSQEVAVTYHGNRMAEDVNEVEVIAGPQNEADVQDLVTVSSDKSPTNSVEVKEDSDKSKLLDIYSLLGLSEEEVDQVEPTSEQTIVTPNPPETVVVKNDGIDRQQQQEQLVSLTDVIDGKGAATKMHTVAFENANTVEPVREVPEERIAETIHEEVSEVVMMRNDRYVNAHKKRMELAAKKREPQVRKLPPAVNYRKILAKNEKLRQQQSQAGHNQHMTPQVPEVDAFSDKQLSPERRKDTEMSERKQRPERSGVSYVKSANKAIEHSPVRKPVKPAGSRSHPQGYRRSANVKSAAADCPKDTYYGEIQVKDNELDEENRFEMLVVVHDSDEEHDEEVHNVIRMRDAAVGPSDELDSFTAHMDEIPHHNLMQQQQGQQQLHPSKEYFMTPHIEKKLPSMPLQHTNQFRLLRSAQQRNEQLIAEMKAKAATGQSTNERENTHLELEALDTIKDTLSSAINVCDYSLQHSILEPVPEEEGHHLMNNNHDGALDHSVAGSHMTTYKELLLEEKKHLLLQWKVEEQKRLVDEEVNAIEQELKDKIKRKEEHDLQLELQNKRLEQLTIVEELRQHELQRLKVERELKQAAEERVQRKKARLEQKALNNRINAFLETQEETLQRLKDAKQQQWDEGWSNDVEHDENELGGGLLPSVPENDDMAPYQPRVPLSKRDGVAPRKAPKQKAPRGRDWNKYSQPQGHGFGDVDSWSSRSEYIDSDAAERRKERNEYYRAQQAEKERQKQQDIREIQERLNPDMFRGQGNKHDKNRLKQGGGMKPGRHKKVAPSTDYSSMLSRNRKARQQATSGKHARKISSHRHDRSKESGGRRSQPQHQQSQSQSQSQSQPHQDEHRRQYAHPSGHMPNEDPFNLFHSQVPSNNSHNPAGQQYQIPHPVPPPIQQHYYQGAYPPQMQVHQQYQPQHHPQSYNDPFNLFNQQQNIPLYQGVAPPAIRQIDPSMQYARAQVQLNHAAGQLADADHLSYFKNLQMKQNFLNAHPQLNSMQHDAAQNLPDIREKVGYGAYQVPKAQQLLVERELGKDFVKDSSQEEEKSHVTPSHQALDGVHGVLNNTEQKSPKVEVENSAEDVNIALSLLQPEIDDDGDNNDKDASVFNTNEDGIPVSSEYVDDLLAKLSAASNTQSPSLHPDTNTAEDQDDSVLHTDDKVDEIQPATQSGVEETQPPETNVEDQTSTYHKQPEQVHASQLSSEPTTKDLQPAPPAGHRKSIGGAFMGRFSKEKPAAGGSKKRQSSMVLPSSNNKEVDNILRGMSVNDINQSLYNNFKK